MTTDRSTGEAVARVGGTIVILMGVARIGRIAERAARRRPRPRHARWPRCAGAPGPSRRTVRATLAHDRRRARSATPSVIVVGRGGRRRPGVVRAAAAVRAAGRGHPHPRAGVGAVARAARARAPSRSRCRSSRSPTRPTAARALRSAVARARRLRLGRAHVARTAPSGCSARCDDAGLDARAFGARPRRGHRPGHGRGAGRPAASRADLVPERFVAESLLEALPGTGSPGRVLLARAEVARDVLPDGLRARGLGRSTWSTPTARCPPPSPTSSAPPSPAPTSSRSRRRPPSSASSRPSASTRCRRWSPASARSPRPRRARHGLAVDVEAEVHTIDGLVDALVDVGARR